MQVIAQSPSQVTLLLFFDGLFVDHAHTPYWNKLYCDSDYPIFFINAGPRFALARGSSKRAALSVSRDSLGGYMQKQSCVYRA